jgi:hypothetical protein
MGDFYELCKRINNNFKSCNIGFLQHLSRIIEL